MTRVLILLLIGAATFLVIWLLNNPDAMEGVWLYLVGLSGVIIKVSQTIYEKIKELFEDTKTKES